jgi:hypothetical protein
MDSPARNEDWTPLVTSAPLLGARTDTFMIGAGICDIFLPLYLKTAQIYNTFIPLYLNIVFRSWVSRRSEGAFHGGN